MKDKNEIDELWQEFKLNDNLEARDSLIEYYLPLVEKIVRRIFAQKRAIISSDLDLEDLISIGTIALIKAIDNFDIERGTSFESYAYKMIHGYVFNYISSKLPISTKSYKRLRKSIEENWEENPEKAQQKLRDLIHGIALAKLISLERAITVDEDLKIIDRIADDSWLSPQAMVENKEILQKIKELLENLTPHEKRVIIEYYYENKKFVEIANELGITRQRISQLHNTAIRKLRIWLKRLEEGDTQREK